MHTFSRKLGNLTTCLYATCIFEFLSTNSLRDITDILIGVAIVNLVDCVGDMGSNQRWNVSDSIVFNRTYRKAVSARMEIQ